MLGERTVESAERAVDATADRKRVGTRRLRRSTHLLQTIRLLVVTDALSLAVAGALALAFRDDSSVGDVLLRLPLPVLMAEFAFVFYRLYERDKQQIAVATLDEWRDFLNALSIVCLIEIVAVQAYQPLDAVLPPTASEVAVYWLAAMVMLPATRAFVRRHVFPLIHAEDRALIVGAGRVGQRLALKILKHTEYNTCVVGFLDDQPHELDPRLAHIPVLGGEDDLVEVIREQRRLARDPRVLAQVGRTRLEVVRERRAARRPPVDRPALLRDHRLERPDHRRRGHSGDRGPRAEALAVRTRRRSARSISCCASLGLFLLAPMFIVIAICDQARLARPRVLPAAPHGSRPASRSRSSSSAPWWSAPSSCAATCSSTTSRAGRCSRSAHDPRVTRVGARSAPAVARRAASALQRPPRRDEPRRAAPVRRLRGRPDRAAGRGAGST